MTLIWLPVFMPHTREEEVGQELFNDSKYVCLLDSNPEKEDRTTLAEQVIFFFFLLIARNSFSLLAWSKLQRCYKQKHTSKKYWWHSEVCGENEVRANIIVGELSVELMWWWHEHIVLWLYTVCCLNWSIQTDSNSKLTKWVPDGVVVHICRAVSHVKRQQDTVWLFDMPFSISLTYRFMDQILTNFLWGSRKPHFILKDGSYCHHTPWTEHESAFNRSD